MTNISHISYETIKDQFSKEHSNSILLKYPTKIPIIIWEIHNDLNLDKRKFIAGKELTIGQFLYVIRKRCKINSKEGIYIFVHTKNGIIMPVNSELLEVTHFKHNIDGFLRLSVSKENTFG